MKIRLTREARILHRAGETLDVSPAEARFLCSVGSAVRLPEFEAPRPRREATPTTTAKKKEQKK